MTYATRATNEGGIAGVSPLCTDYFSACSLAFSNPVFQFAGAFSGVVTKTATAPLERVKILLQLRGMSGVQGGAIHGLPESTHLFGVLSHIVRYEGVAALFKGNLANVVRVGPVYALKFSFNDRFKDLVRRPGQTNRDMTTGQLMVSGTLGGLCQIILTYPLEVVRTRLSLSSQSLEGAYNGMWDCMKHTVRLEGWSGLYKGITATIWSGAPYVGLQMTSYELVKRQLVRLPAIFVEQPDHQTHPPTPPPPAVASRASPSDLISVPPASSIPVVTTPASSPSRTVDVNMLGKLTAGGLSGLISQTLTFPGDTVRRRMQTNGLGGKPKLYTTTWDCTVKVWRREGVHGFMRGAMTNVWRCIPGAAIQFAAFEECIAFLGASSDYAATSATAKKKVTF